MRYLVLLFTILQFSMANAQRDTSYQALWRQVEKLENEALTKSALKVVQSISEKAKEEGRSPQVVKALLYTSKYALTLEEDAQLKIVGDFKSEIQKAAFPVKNVLKSYLGNLYWQYFQQNRYRFYDRTKTEVKVDSIDFRTWDLTTLFEEIHLHFTASLENPSKLQTLNVNEFQEILTKQKGSEIYRPTLFDLLAHTALQFYKTPENTITRPADKFEMDNPKLLCEAYQFTELSIDFTDKTSLQSRALQIYQELTKFHFPDVRLEALVDVDIERLRFIHQNAVFPNKDAAYLDVLQNSAENLSHHEVSGLYRYEIALLYNQWGNSYQSKSKEEHRWKLKEALTLCESVIAQFPESTGAEKCKALRSEILSKSLQLTVEQHIPIDSPSRILVNYKNLDELQFVAYEASNNDIKKLNTLYPESEQLNFIKKLSAVKNWEAQLKNENDFQRHDIEVLLPKLGNGQYILLAVPKADVNKTFAYAKIQVTNLALVETQTPEHHQFQLIDRNNGKPLESAKLQFTYQENYDRKFLTETFTTNDKGAVRIPLGTKRWTSIGIKAVYNGDMAHFGEYYIGSKSNSRILGSLDNSAFLFTDRSIYRPGQVLYFKGIAVSMENDVSKILSNIPVTVSLRNVNYQEMAKLEVTTNEFGSFSGKFILPANGLTGSFSLQASSKSIKINGTTDFSVEEYKRPKFQTSFEPVQETYKVNDSITVKGTATAYAGSAITDAQVAYRVSRVVYFPRWYYWSRPYFNTSPQEIAHGSTVTDASGNYTINFKAIPDNSIERNNLPTFSYEITADVTDINGETHTATRIVRVGYHSLNADIRISDRLDKNAKDHTIEITTTNLNGQAVDTKGALKMYKLQPPKYVLRNRPWAAPDYQNWDKSSFRKLFPHDAYSNEHDFTTWAKGKLVWESDFDTGKSTEFPLDTSKKWESGKYILELQTQDKFGQVVKAKTITTLFVEKDAALADNQLFDIKLDKSEYQIGERVKITLASAAKDLSVSVNVEKDRKIVDTRIIRLNQNVQSFTLPVTQSDLGGFAIHYSFSAFNAFTSGSLAVPVPYPKTDLEIETVTFRDKLQPNTAETWTFKLKGPKGDKVAAELLASMYDASLDAFRGHSWDAGLDYRPTYYSNVYSNAYRSFGTEGFRVYYDFSSRYNYQPRHYDTFDWFGFHFGYGLRIRGTASDLVRKSSAPPAAMEVMEEVAAVNEVAMVENDLSGNVAGIAEFDKASEENQGVRKEADFSTVAIRKNLQETAFFFPQLRTDREGNVSFSFTTPEALTTWKLQLLAHDKNLQSTYTALEAVTQKELMVIPNAPRFLREGDEITISTKIANLTNQKLSGQAKLQLVDALTGEDVTKKLFFTSSSSGEIAALVEKKEFSVDSLGNTQVSWRLKIPEGIQAVQYTILAKAGDFSDGEQNVLPVLTNRMLVTETLPMWVGGNQTKTFVLDKLRDNTSTTLSNHKLTLEITSNPAWYAVQALPYLMEYPYECNEQIFAKYYANTLAGHIANSNPRIREVFDQWLNSDALLSNLEKNSELKSLLIQETPWLRDAQSETEQKKRIALLFDLHTLRNEQANSMNRLQQNQMSSGAWAWFKGGRGNRYITQHIIAGLGHLNHLKVANIDNRVSQMLKSALQYLDSEFVSEYEQMKKYAKNPKNDHLSQMQIHYLYMRSFFKDIKTSKKVDEVLAYYRGQAQKYWAKKGLYSKGMLALALYRMNDRTSANKILRSLRENSISNEELGMYWKENTASWHWYQAPIETQALMIEAFSEIDNDSKTVDKLKVWLLKHKQTNQWETTKATTEAVYALLLQGNDWLSLTETVEVSVGKKKIEPSKVDDVKMEAGTGYYKTSWSGKEVESEMASVTLVKKGAGIAWGGLYWQYFEDLDKITSAETPLRLKKKLFLKRNMNTGEEISAITTSIHLKVGDLIRVRIELKADRDMEFIHMKDMRAAGLEPITVLSGYKWQDGLGYYESTKDASTNFFFDYLPKGVYVFEYDLRVNNAGDFSNGITTIQSMYAPEFSSHSEGVRVTAGSGR
ncbi:alpha-2-macroglobulin family protein [Ulvibacterium sp.]|uniref:alpha-2-macroglobulin family protein n=1 Tax=Ulvibacterium sp. TaxID=2665914 RepID=UPI003BAA30F9